MVDVKVICIQPLNAQAKLRQQIIYHLFFNVEYVFYKDQLLKIITGKPSQKCVTQNGKGTIKNDKKISTYSTLYVFNFAIRYVLVNLLVGILLVFVLM